MIEEAFLMLWVLVLTMLMTTIALATLHKHCDVRDADDEYYGGDEWRWWPALFVSFYGMFGVCATGGWMNCEGTEVLSVVLLFLNTFTGGLLVLTVITAMFTNVIDRVNQESSKLYNFHLASLLDHMLRCEEIFGEATHFYQVLVQSAGPTNKQSLYVTVSAKEKARKNWETIRTSLS